MNIVREANEDNILKWLVKKDSNLILFHHRQPTSTVNVAKAAHPFSTKKYFGKVEYIMVHNGVIRNATELWAAHQKLGIRYMSLLDDLTFNDSEALMWDFCLTLEGRQDKMKASGNMAFICMKKVNGKLVEMLYGRNTNPLMIKRTPDSLELSSEGEGVSILSNMLYQFNFKTHVVTKSDMEFPVYAAASTTPWYDRGREGTYPNSGFHGPSTQQSLLSPHATGNEEFESYDQYHINRYGIKSSSIGAPSLPQRKQDVESNWERLRKKFSKTTNDDEVAEAVAQVLEADRLDSASSKSIGNILEAKRDKKGKFIVGEVQHKDVPVDIDNVDLRDYRPMTTEIQNCAMEYMIEAQGNFDNAYALLELAYTDFQDSVAGKESLADIRQVLLFEAAMEFINSDPEYQNEKSTSSIWEALWFQKLATT